MKIENLVQTCTACPSKWHFDIIDDRFDYVLYGSAYYRYGLLMIKVDDGHRTPIYHERIGDTLDGVISWEEVERRIKDLDIKAELDKVRLI